METSAKTSMNVNEIFMAIGKIAHSLFLCCPPAGRLRVKRHLLWCNHMTVIIWVGLVWWHQQEQSFLQKKQSLSRCSESILTGNSLKSVNESVVWVGFTAAASFSDHTSVNEGRRQSEPDQQRRRSAVIFISAMLWVYWEWEWLYCQLSDFKQFQRMWKASWRSPGHLWSLWLWVLCRHTHVSPSANDGGDPVLLALMYFCHLCDGWITSFLATVSPDPVRTRAVLAIRMLMSTFFICLIFFTAAKKLPKNEPQAAGANSGRNRGVDLTETAQPTSRTCCNNWSGFCSSPSSTHTCPPALLLLSPPQLNYI